MFTDHGMLIVLRRLSSCVTWFELEPVFGIRYSHLSDIFWEVMESFVHDKAHLITTFQTGMLQKRSELYANAIKKAGTPLNSSVGFIDCTNIGIARPGGIGNLHCSCYSGHKREHCLI